MDTLFSSSFTPRTENVTLKPEVFASCVRRARMQGMVAGVTSGFLGGLIGMRLLRFDRKNTLLSGVLTCMCSGFLFTQAFLGTQIAEAVSRETHLRQQTASSGFIPDESSQDTAKVQRFA